MVIAAWLDRVLYRHPFEGASARRYAHQERPAFGDLDDRLLDGMAPLEAGAGWQLRTRRDDPVQPVYILELA